VVLAGTVSPSSIPSRVREFTADDWKNAGINAAKKIVGADGGDGLLLESAKGTVQLGLLSLDGLAASLHQLVSPLVSPNSPFQPAGGIYAALQARGVEDVGREALLNTPLVKGSVALSNGDNAAYLEDGIETLVTFGLSKLLSTSARIGNTFGDVERAGASDLSKVGFGSDVKLYPYDPPGALLKQALPDSCVAAACRMKLNDLGVEVPEAYLRADLGYVSKEGISFRNVPNALAIPENGAIQSVFSRDSMRLGGLRDSINSNGAAIANVNGHAVVVDGISGGMVKVRDPWNGAYEVGVRDFLRGWQNNSRIAITFEGTSP
jgi:hypothetical protein